MKKRRLFIKGGFIGIVVFLVAEIIAFGYVC